MNEMKERIARAIGEALHRSDPRFEIEWPYIMCNDANAGCLLSDIATAALEAMRNPTDEMLDGKYGVEPRKLFTKMIDDALETKKAAAQVMSGGLSLLGGF